MTGNTNGEGQNIWKQEVNQSRYYCLLLARHRYSNVTTDRKKLAVARERERVDDEISSNSNGFLDK